MLAMLRKYNIYIQYLSLALRQFRLEQFLVQKTFLNPAWRGHSQKSKNPIQGFNK